MDYQATVTISRDFNLSWNSLKDDASLKRAVIASLAAMYGYDGCSFEQFVRDFRGKGKVRVEDTWIVVEFSDLRMLGIDVDSASSTADLDHMFRKKLVEGISGAKTEADKLSAHSKIFGTVVNGINTTPPSHT